MTPDEGPLAGGEYGPYRQSERSELYASACATLVEKGLAYYAFDTTEALTEARSAAEAKGDVFRYGASSRGAMDNSLGLSTKQLRERLQNGEPHVIRLLVEPGQEVAFRDRVRGSVRFSTDELDDKVLLKADGMPTYHLANVVDDHHMEITHVIRGEEWLPSTAHHVLLYEAFDWTAAMPEFAHLPLILKPEGKGKLSKRDGAKFGMPVFPLEWEDKTSGDTFSGFRESGFLPEAVVNFLAFLGWNPGTEQELFSLKELVEAFDLEQIGKSGARFDYDKAKWFNQQHLGQLSPAEFVRVVEPSLTAAGIETNEAFLMRVAPLMRERLTSANDLATDAHYLFDTPAAFDDKQALKRLGKADLEELSGVSNVLSEAVEWTAPALASAVKGWAAESGVKLGVLLPLYRIALTGGMSGPDVFELSELLGKEETVARWEQAIAHFRILKRTQE